MAVTSKKRVSIRSRLTAIRRTRQMVSDQIDIIDRAAPDREAPPGEMVQALTSLVKLLESLQRLERCHRNERAQRTVERKERLDDTGLRDELARRIDALCAARDAGGGPEVAEPQGDRADQR